MSGGTEAVYYIIQKTKEVQNNVSSELSKRKTLLSSLHRIRTIVDEKQAGVCELKSFVLTAEVEAAKQSRYCVALRKHINQIASDAQRTQLRLQNASQLYRRAEMLNAISSQLVMVGQNEVVQHVKSAPELQEVEVLRVVAAADLCDQELFEVQQIEEDILLENSCLKQALADREGSVHKLRMAIKILRSSMSSQVQVCNREMQVLVTEVAQVKAQLDRALAENISAQQKLDDLKPKVAVAERERQRLRHMAKNH